jgi:hypothetical protein
MIDTYTKIKGLLEKDRKYRNDDRYVHLDIWAEEEPVFRDPDVREAYMRVTSSETIRRTRQKVQAQHPELDADEDVKRKRNSKEKLGGHFVWNNQKPQFSKQHIEGVLAILHKKYDDHPELRTGEEWEKDLAKGKQYRKMLDDLNANDLEDTARKIFETSPLTPQTGGIK